MKTRRFNYFSRGKKKKVEIIFYRSGLEDIKKAIEENKEQVKQEKQPISWSKRPGRSRKTNKKKRRNR